MSNSISFMYKCVVMYEKIKINKIFMENRKAKKNKIKSRPFICGRWVIVGDSGSI